MKKLSLIIPLFNEEHNIHPLYKTLCYVLSDLEFENVEIIFINDGSSDQTWKKVSDIALQDKRIKALNFSRNFGHQAALTAGYDVAMGDAIITMDADMQDPPELITSMIDLWKDGADIVYARRIDRGDTFVKRVTAQWYYKLLSSIADVSIPRNVGDFRLIDKTVLQYLKQCRETSRYLRGMVAWMGFTCEFVDFKRPDRLHGDTGYTWKKMMQLAFDGVTGFSLFPLRVAAFVGIFVMITGSLMFSYITYDAIFRNVHYPLFKWLVTIMYMFMGVQFLLMWILGEYMGRMFEHQKGRPLYILKQKVNIDDKEFRNQ